MELAKLLSEKELKDAALLILANKQVRIILILLAENNERPQKASFKNRA